MTAEEVERCTILRCEAGSTVLGLSTGSADRDELGICVEPLEYVIGLKRFEQHVFRTQPEGVRSGPGDLDLTVYSLRKWCSLALKGNPTILMMLFVPDGPCSVLAPEAQYLRDELAWAFASRKSGNAFLGYMQAQRQRLMGERGQRRVKRPELEEEHGYDTKYAGHILRLGFQGVEYLGTGRITVPMREHERALILRVRRGDVDLNHVLNVSGLLEVEMKELLDSSPLPEEPAYDAVNDFLIDTYASRWSPSDLA